MPSSPYKIFCRQSVSRLIPQPANPSNFLPNFVWYEKSIHLKETVTDEVKGEVVLSLY